MNIDIEELLDAPFKQSEEEASKRNSRSTSSSSSSSRRHKSSTSRDEYYKNRHDDRRYERSGSGNPSSRRREYDDYERGGYRNRRDYDSRDYHRGGYDRREYDYRRGGINQEYYDGRRRQQYDDDKRSVRSHPYSVEEDRSSYRRRDSEPRKPARSPPRRSSSRSSQNNTTSSSNNNNSNTMQVAIRKRSTSVDSYEGNRDTSISEIERDARTVFVTQLAKNLKSREVAEFFSDAGTVNDVRIVLDRITGKSKGVGYVEFASPSSILSAVQLTGRRLKGVPIVVQASNADKNITEVGELKSLAVALHSQVNQIPITSLTGVSDEFRRVFVGNIHFSFTKHDIEQLFQEIGKIEYVNLRSSDDDSIVKSRGYAFIQYENAIDAKSAVARMNGFDLAGRSLKVELVRDDSGYMVNFAGTFCPPSRKSSDLLPSQYIILKNVFDPSEEVDDKWRTEVEDAVKPEVEKFGNVLQFFVDLNTDGDIYVKFETIEGAEACRKVCDGRFFQGRQVACLFLTDAAYKYRFGDESAGVEASSSS